MSPRAARRVLSVDVPTPTYMCEVCDKKWPAPWSAIECCCGKKPQHRYALGAFVVTPRERELLELMREDAYKQLVRQCRQVVAEQLTKEMNRTNMNRRRHR